MNSSFLTRTLFSRRSLAAILVASGAAACSAAPSASTEQTAMASDALTITGLFPTGVDDLGAQIGLGAVDPHYTLSSADPNCAGPNLVGTDPSQVTSAWIANQSPARWISCAINAPGLPDTDYTYSTTFTLPAGVPPSTVTLSGSWACDDFCSISVNGQSTGIVSQNPNFRDSAPPAPSTFVIPAGATFFRAGINTIQFVVHNVTGNQALQIVSIAASAGCAADKDCDTGTFCNTESEVCVAQLANGVGIPIISGHTPELDGVCTQEVGAVVCASGVCDTADNVCGFDLGHACVANTECRSNDCDPTTKLCVPGCTVDTDCGDGNFCNTASHVCMPQLANGKPIPTISGHTPPLDGICTPEVGTLVCVSGVCDIGDNVCGFDLGHACVANTECRSNNCDPTTKLCVPGCTVDADCGDGNFCNTELQMCTPLLDNGVPIPTIPGHEPPLDGICTPDVGAAVCASGVCDLLDNLCGLADGSGTCTDNAQCRSGNCDVEKGVCKPSLPCCGNTYGAELGNGDCIICTDAGPSPNAGSDASGDSGSSMANGSDNSSQAPQGSSGNNPAPSGQGSSASSGGCQMSGGASNTGLGMMAGLFAMVAGAWRRRRKVVQG